MAKIGIYIPDNKVEEIEEWKSRLNLSEVFRAAFDRSVAKQKALEFKGDEMEKLIVRLKQNRNESHQAGKEGSFEMGVEWAKEIATLANFRRLCETDEEIEPEDLIAITEVDVEQWIGENDDRPAYLAGWRDGFLDGVRSVWAKVKNKI